MPVQTVSYKTKKFNEINNTESKDLIDPLDKDCEERAQILLDRQNKSCKIKKSNTNQCHDLRANNSNMIKISESNGKQENRESNYLAKLDELDSISSQQSVESSN